MAQHTKIRIRIKSVQIDYGTQSFVIEAEPAEAAGVGPLGTVTLFLPWSACGRISVPLTEHEMVQIQRIANGLVGKVLPLTQED